MVLFDSNKRLFIQGFLVEWIGCGSSGISIHGYKTYIKQNSYHSGFNE